MRIAVDAAASQGGNYTLMFNILSGLGKIDSKNQYILYSFEPLRLDLPQNFKNIVVKKRFGWLQFWLSLELILHPCDLFMGFNQALPFFLKSKSVVFILDLAFEIFPQYFTKISKIIWQTKNACKKADRIIAISESTKYDLIKLYNINPHKIKVVQLGI